MRYVIFFMLATFLSACATPSQVYWDHKVKELCEKDGGVTVYEKVELTKAEFNKISGYNGSVRAPVEEYAKEYDIFISKTEKSDLQLDGTTVYKLETKVFRKSDMKLIGKEISYSRRGGDLPTGVSHPSSFSCGDIDGITTNLNREIYIIQGE